MNQIHRFVETVASTARRTGLRQLVEVSPLTDMVWRQARRTILGFAPKVSAKQQPAPQPPKEPSAEPTVAGDPLDAIEPRLFRAAMAERFAAMNIDPELKALYSSFALSTVARGKHMRDFISTQTPIQGKRYLDVGCAYGGFLVAFHAAGAREVVGFDYAQDLLALAKIVIQDYGTPARLEHASILEPNIAQRFGQFDIVTCNDVIEHVGDPRAALANLSRLLTPQGILCMEIPNRFAANFVRRDGHFYKFGLSSLPKYLADRRFTQETNGGFHDVTYKSLRWYRNVLERCGLKVDVVNAMPQDFETTFANCSAVFDDIAWRSKQPEIDLHTARYAQRLTRSFRDIHGKWRAKASLHDPKASELTKRMALTFKEEFWLLVARRA